VDDGFYKTSAVAAYSNLAAVQQANVNENKEGTNESISNPLFKQSAVDHAFNGSASASSVKEDKKHSSNVGESSMTQKEKGASFFTLVSPALYI
jgi:hypothetical protein